jgi:branched-chain amino acid transport system ATP-binding protein
MILELAHVDTFYGSSHVLQAIDLSVAERESVALLGRNGVGKTTTLRTIMGLAPGRAGSIRFLGREIRGQPADTVARLGIAYVPDDHRIFPELFPTLRELGSSKGLNLSGGEKKMLAIGRALMANPSLLLLDEPSEGLAPLVVAQFVEVLNRIKRDGVTILLADQNLRFCRKVCDRGYILEKGRVQHSGKIDEISRDEQIVRKYLAV